MSLLRSIRLQLRALFRSGRHEDDMEDEMRAHLEQLVDDFRAEGLSDQQAKKRALKEFGNVEAFKEDCRDSWGVCLINDFLTDIRMGWRQAVKNRRFSFIIILTLGLCIGVNTAIFSMLNNYLFTRYPDYPYPDREQLVRVCCGTLYKGKVMMPDRVPFAVYGDLEHAESLAEIGFCQNGSDDIFLGGSMYAKPSMLVSPSFFRVLGVQPLIGRWFDEEEKLDGRHRVVVLSYTFWQSEFAGDPKVLGTRLELNAESFEVVGVMPKGFYFQDRNTSLWRPKIFKKNQTSSLAAGMMTFLTTIARLDPQASRGHAQAELKAILSNLAEPSIVGPPENRMTAGDLKLEDYYYSADEHPKQNILLLQGSALLVLLIGCLNIANLLLSRLSSRSREVALRAMLGAGTGRIARMLLTESLLYGIVGCLLGLCLGFISIEVIKYFEFYIVYNRGPLRLDRTVLIYTISITLVCIIFIGGISLFSARRLRLNSGNHDGERSTSVGRADKRLRGLLIVSQVSAACVLLITTGMLLKSLGNLLNVDPGFNPNQTVVINQIRPSSKFNRHQRNQYFNGLIEHLKEIPGVEAVGSNGSYPFSGLAFFNTFILEGQSEPITGHAVNLVKGSYFEAIDQKFLEGRTFDRFDFAENSEPVAIVDQDFASKYFPNESALGKRLKHNPREGNPNWTTIIGVIENVKQRSLAETRENRSDQIYVPSVQWVFYNGSIIVRYSDSGINEESISKYLITDRLISAIHEYNPRAPRPQVVGYEDIIGDSLKERRVLLGILITFAFLALLLSSIGLYGVISYAVQQRRKEIGIRLAVGASRGSIIKLIVQSGMTLTLIGLSIGLVGAVVASHIIRSQLFQVATLDGVVYLLVGALIVTISFLASYLPSRRVVDVDPISALRGD